MAYQEEYQEIRNDYFEEYKKLGGKKNRRKYDKIVEIFLDETHDIFIFGDPIKHESRVQAGYAVMDKADISVDEYNLIFESIDNITAYT
jgi:hypothetical protein